MIGEFGDAETDPPAKVLVVDDLLSDGATGAQVNFRGAEISVIPLAEGPTLCGQTSYLQRFGPKQTVTGLALQTLNKSCG